MEAVPRSVLRCVQRVESAKLDGVNRPPPEAPLLSSPPPPRFRFTSLGLRPQIKAGSTSELYLLLQSPTIPSNAVPRLPTAISSPGSTGFLLVALACADPVEVVTDPHRCSAKHSSHSSHSAASSYSSPRSSDPSPSVVALYPPSLPPLSIEFSSTPVPITAAGTGVKSAPRCTTGSAASVAKVEGRFCSGSGRTGGSYGAPEGLSS